MFDACTSPAIYGLVVIAHNEGHALIACEQPKPGILNGIGILELID